MSSPTPSPGFDDTDKKVFEPEHHEEANSDKRDVEKTGGLKNRFKANTQIDDAARLLEEAGGHVDYTPEDNKRVLRKVDIFVCIPMCIVYFLRKFYCVEGS